MRSKDHFIIKFFIGVAIGLLSLLLVSLPGRAGVADGFLSALTDNKKGSSYSANSQSNNTLLSSPISTTSVTPTGLITDTQSITPSITLTPASTPTPADTSTPTYTSTSVYTSTPSLTPTPIYTATPADTSTPTTLAPANPDQAQKQFSYLPSVYRYYAIPTPPPPETVLFCDNLAQPISIPDNNIDGVNDVISTTDGRVLVSVSLYLNISHSFVGDLVVKLTHQDTGKVVRVLDQPGAPQNKCGNNDIVAILDDAAAQYADDQCASYPHAISGIYLPSNNLSVFSGENVSGSWRLNVSDRVLNDTGTLNHWCLVTKLADSMPPPTPTPTPVNLPSSASVGGMSGQNQQLPLDCESRSAVDWARHFGSNIDEIDFLNHLPVSDDPETGFVGDPNGTWGNIPPNDYGVHSPPVATLLQQYGLIARSFRSLRWDDLRAEIAGGNPAIVWIIGGSSYNLVNGTPHLYTTASTGDSTIVAPGEHTVILVGYTPSDVTILNGSRIINVPLDQFLDSWSVLDFMAVLAQP